MASIISAGTTSGTSLNLSGDTSGVLQLASNGSTTAVTIDTSQNVGIGTSSPSVKLEVNNGNLVVGNAGSNFTIQASRTGANASSLSIGAFTNEPDIRWTYTGSGALRFTDATTSAERMRISSGGNLLVGTSSVQNAGNAITCFGGFYSFCLNSGSFNYYFGTDSNNFNVYSGDGVLRGYLGTAGAWTNTSDIAFKKDIVDITYSLQDALNLRPVSYLTKDYEIPQIGFIAQEMEQVIPEVVSGKEGSKGISYGSLVALCVKAIQDLNAKVDAQAAEIQALKGTAL